jgi:hypothetical protein
MFSFDDVCRKLPGNPTTTVMLNIMNSALQQCPPWTLRAWAPLLWQVGKQIPLRLRHIGTQITNPGDAMFRTVGQTLWAGYGSDGDVGMAWDWVQLTRGVVAMADPMAVVTNLRLVGDEGQVLDVYESARHINFIVHGLPWQDEVERALCAPASSPMPATPGILHGLSIGAPGSLLAQ